MLYCGVVCVCVCFYVSAVSYFTLMNPIELTSGWEVLTTGNVVSHTTREPVLAVHAETQRGSRRSGGICGPPGLREPGTWPLRKSSGDCEASHGIHLSCVFAVCSSIKEQVWQSGSETIATGMTADSDSPKRSHDSTSQS